MAQVSLLQAYTVFDPDRGVTFATWAARLMVQDLRDVVRKARGQTDGEAKTITQKFRYDQAQARGTNGVEPPSLERWEAAQRTLCWRPVSLEGTSVGGNSKGKGIGRETLRDCLEDPTEPDPWASVEEDDLFGCLAELLEEVRPRLTEQERYVLNAYLGDPECAGPAVAAELGVTRQRVDQARESALYKLLCLADEWDLLEASPQEAFEWAKQNFPVTRSYAQWRRRKHRRAALSAQSSSVVDLE